jgi:hypothetical protein
MPLDVLNAGTGNLVRLLGAPTAYFVTREECADTVVITGSYLGVLPARVMRDTAPRGIVGVDCDALDGSGMAGLWYLEAIGISALTVGVREVILMDPRDIYQRGHVSQINQLAWLDGIRVGMHVADAVALMRVRQSARPGVDVSRRVVVHTVGERSIVCLDSIAYALPLDKGRNVLCCGGYAGAPNMIKSGALGIICSDGGRGRNNVGQSGLDAVEKLGIPAATVDSRTAWMGDGLSTYEVGLISACNRTAYGLGAKVGSQAGAIAQMFLQRS